MIVFVILIGNKIDRLLWFLGSEVLKWLDGSFLGDYGFDFLDFGKKRMIVG